MIMSRRWIADELAHSVLTWTLRRRASSIPGPTGSRRRAHDGQVGSPLEQNTSCIRPMKAPHKGGSFACTANITLDVLERLLKEHFPRESQLFEITPRFMNVTSKDLLEQSANPCGNFMAERCLHLSPRKPVSLTYKTVRFLRPNVRKYKEGKRYKILIKPSKKSVHALLDKIRTIVKKNKALLRVVDPAHQSHPSC